MSVSCHGCRARCGRVAVVVIVTVIVAGAVGSGSRRCMSVGGAPLATDAAGDTRKTDRLNGFFPGTLRSEL
jgi:hypothetical protein